MHFQANQQATVGTGFPCTNRKYIMVCRRPESRLDGRLSLPPAAVKTPRATRKVGMRAGKQALPGSPSIFKSHKFLSNFFFQANSDLHIQHSKHRRHSTSCSVYGQSSFLPTFILPLAATCRTQKQCDRGFSKSSPTPDTAPKNTPA